MKFDCIINMDNDAFANDKHLELSRILNKIAREFYEFECIERTKTIWDTNGNKIGTWEIKV
mgnify:FL=1